MAAVFILVLAAVNTGNNLLFLILACLLAGILISGVLSRVVLTGVEMKFDLPEHIFAEQPVLAEIELRNDKQMWPSFSLRVIGGKKKAAAEVLTRPVFFPVPSAAERHAAESRTAISATRRLPAGFVRDPHAVSVRILSRRRARCRRTWRLPSILALSRPTSSIEVLPLLTGEMASFFRGRGHELHSLRDYVPTDSARFVDWKVTAKSGRLVVREFAREDERRVMLVLDPFVGPPRADLGQLAEAEHAERFERAVSLAACIAWHFNEIHSVMQFRTNSFSTPMAPAGDIIYDVLRELCDDPARYVRDADGAFIDELAGESEVFKIILTTRAQRTIPTGLWSSSYFLFIDQL